MGNLPVQQGLSLRMSTSGHFPLFTSTANLRIDVSNTTIGLDYRGHLLSQSYLSRGSLQQLEEDSLLLWADLTVSGTQATGSLDRYPLQLTGQLLGSPTL